MHKNWRDCQEWEKFGLKFSTTSNEACKLYDAALTQYVGWYDDASVGGLEGCIGKLLQTDPQFVMGHVIANGLELMGTGRSVHMDKEFQQSIDTMVKLAQSSNITERERKHVNAVKLFADGDMDAANNVWEDILMHHPKDMLALKFAHDTNFYLGYQPQMRDAVARVMPHWNERMPLYGYLLGMHSFGLVETNFYEQSEKVARKGLEINRQDAWSTHSLAHVFEMMGRQKEGIAFMSSTVADWSYCGMLACHNFWHWAVYHIEKGEYQGALDIFDTEVGKKANTTGAMLDIVDASSLLFRLEMEGQDVGGRWSDLYETILPHIEDHILAFNDVHILLPCLGNKKTDTAQKMMNSLREFVRTGQGTNCTITKEVGLAVCEAVVAYEEGDFAKAVDLVYPVRYKVVTIGGSNAQRDLFNLFLINAALRSNSKAHHQIARQLLVERKALKENAPMTDRLIAKAMALHAD